MNNIDYVRLATIDLLAREIKEKGIEGSVAELGVYRGNLTKFLFEIFSDRSFVLLDTFEGFDIKDVTVELENNFSKSNVKHLNDVDFNVIKKLIQGKSNVDVVKGYFPDSIAQFPEKEYAFVSLDVDLYQPTLEGLKYFYPKLSIGGYLIVHDYNFKTYSGVKKAIREFEKSEDVLGIPISDYYGSYVFVKSKA